MVAGSTLESSRGHRRCSRVLSALCLALLLCIRAPVALAQVVSNIAADGTLNTTVTQGGNTFNIDGGTIHGANQFHSFDTFSVGTGDIASFNGPGSIANILSRVTGLQSGLQQSVIDGTMRSTIPGANLFFMNPAGIVFGPNAALNVSGSVHFTTADYLLLGQDVPFTALPGPSDLSLSMAPVSAFGFLGEEAPVLVADSTAALAVRGLYVPNASSVALVGRDAQAGASGPMVPAIEISGGALENPGGLVLLSSVNAPGEARVVASVSGAVKDVTLEGFARLGRTRISNAAVDVSGDRAGTVAIRGGQLMIDGAAVFASTLNLDGAPTAIEIGMREEIHLTNGALVSADAFGEGTVGEIKVSGPRVILENGAALRSLAFEGSTGDSANLSVSADTVEVTGSAQILTGTLGEGNGGNIVVGAKALTIEDGAQIASLSLGPGAGGSIDVTATESVTLAGTSADVASPSSLLAIAASTGHAGNITVETGSLTVEGGAQMTSTSFGAGAGGSIVVTATGTVRIAGESANGARGSGLFAQARGTTPDAGDGGSIEVKAKTLLLEGGGQIGNSSFGPGAGGSIHVTATEGVVVAGESANGARGSGLFANASGRNPGAGDGGSIVLEAKHLTIEGGAQITTSSFGPGAGGSVDITATGSVALTGMSGDGFFPSGVFANAEGGAANSGNAGNIVVETKSLTAEGGAQIGTISFGPGAGGNIQVTATEAAVLTGRSANGFFGSGVTAATFGAGDAGNVTLNVGTLALTNGAEIDSASFVGATGNAGSVMIQGLASPAASITVTDSRIVTSAGGTGRGGSITVDATVLMLGAGTVSAAVTDVDPADPTDGPGVGLGNITLTASSLNMSDGLITVSTRGTRNAGVIGVTAGTVTLTGGTITTSTSGSGSGGSILVEARRLSLQGATVSATASQAEGGNVSLTAGQDVVAGNGTVITVQTAGPGNAGDILLEAGRDIRLFASAVTAEAAQADGGNIKLTAPGTVLLRDSKLTTSVGGGPATVGGNIDIDPQFVILQNSQIVAQAFQGQGGNITIVAGTFLQDASSIIDASSQFGLSGRVTIQSPLSNLSQVLAPMPQAPLAAAVLLRSTCAARQASGQASTFVERGRDGLPHEPGSWLAGPLVMRGTEGATLTGVPVPSADGIFLAQAAEADSVPLRRVRHAGPLARLLGPDPSTFCKL